MKKLKERKRNYIPARNCCSAFPKNESKQGQEVAYIFRLKISTYYAYQTKAEESSYLFQKRIKDRLAQLRPKTTSKNVEDECYHLVEETLPSFGLWALRSLGYTFF
ncbi:unnamed protein product [Rhizophagus irregularis]|nr:unnamed protein product [Rhizophagus irregularis]